MRLVKVDCKKVDGGYYHSVWEKNPKQAPNEATTCTLVFGCKFSEVLSDSAYLRSFKDDPVEFIASLSEE